MKFLLAATVDVSLNFLVELHKQREISSLMSNNKLQGD